MSDDKDTSKEDVQEVIDSVFGILTPEESKAVEDSVSSGIKLKETDV